MKKMEKIVIIGAGGSGKDVLATLKRYNKIYNKYEILGFLDDKLPKGKIIYGLPIIGNLNWIEKNSEISCVISNGFSKTRKDIVKKLKEYKINFPSIVDPSVIIADDIDMGKGVIIQAGSIINPDVTIGDFTFINIDCTIGHDCKISSYVTIAPGVNISGNTKINSSTEIGSGSILIQNITIGKNCIIGAGTVIINDVPNDSLMVGNPGKIKKSF